MTKQRRPSILQINMTIMHTIFGNDPVAIANYITNFNKINFQLLNNVKDAIQKQNQAQALLFFHTMKGPVGSCGFITLYKLCEKVEEKIKVGEWITALKLCQDIEEKLHDLESELHDNFNNHV